MSNSRQHRNHEFTGTARASTYREGYPSGWYRLLDLNELKPGDVRALDCLGKNLVVFRGKESGAYRVLDAHCPHQGASLAGGDVQGDNLACPFHHWCFGGDGRLKEIPNTDKRPRVGVRSYPVREHYGMLWMFHDVSGEALDTPPYEPEPIPELEDGTFRYRGRHTVADVGMHLSEFVENSVDFQHFDVLHGDLTWPWTQIKIPGSLDKGSGQRQKMNPEMFVLPIQQAAREAASEPIEANKTACGHCAWSPHRNEG